MKQPSEQLWNEPMKPFEVDEIVRVKRTRHGWYDGHITAVILSRHVRSTGTHFYMARVVEATADYDFKIDEEIQIDYTRDAYRSRLIR